MMATNRMVIQHEFDKYVRAVYPDAPKEGSDQFEQLRDAFFGGCLFGLTRTEDLGRELASYLEAKKMNIAFGGDDGTSTA